MKRADWVKQLMPFDALKGFREALEEKERIIVPRREFSEEQKDKLNHLIPQMEKKDILTVTDFQNGEYIQITGIVSTIDKTEKGLKIVHRKYSI